LGNRESMGLVRRKKAGSIRAGCSAPDSGSLMISKMVRARMHAGLTLQRCVKGHRFRLSEREEMEGFSILHPGRGNWAGEDVFGAKRGKRGLSVVDGFEAFLMRLRCR